ncbi:MAG: quinone-dependent dihydroorotate dehydrogenase [Arthrobacter sp.]|jgi:dihydroorotate dehydrogenase|nr:quinone-dependent dihydroorotate dehydrogenase [Arthrobacter sp.]
MRFYPTFFKIFFSGMQAEKAHHIGFSMIRLAERCGAGAVLRRITRPAGPVTVMGLDFPSPFGLAAGFDKAGHGTTALTELGFGHIEVGTVTGQGQPGNPAPRLFRLVEDAALINRMGFNNPGAEAVAPRLAATRERLQKRYAGKTRPIVGINIGKTKLVELEDAVADYRLSARTLAPYADYLVVNVSSPNTPGLRLLQDVESLRPLLSAVREEADAAAGRHVPLAVKIAPDLADEDVDAVASLAIDLGLDGVVATNTTISREGLVTDPAVVESYGAGGLSGAPVKERSLEVLRRLRAQLPREIALIGVGGVSSPEDVIERLEAGADLVQGYTAFLYEGPFWVSRINKALRKRR